jgi:hypothetical protein
LRGEDGPLQKLALKTRSGRREAPAFRLGRAPARRSTISDRSHGPAAAIRDADSKWTDGFRLPAVPAGFASLIAADFPALLAEFSGKRFALLWRGRRKGFRVDDFHGRCDGRAPPLALIRDPDENTFKGFTSVEWESRRKPPYFKGYSSLKSLLFSLKNPHHFPARRNVLKAEMKYIAINCDSL